MQVKIPCKVRGVEKFAGLEEIIINLGIGFIAHNSNAIFCTVKVIYDKSLTEKFSL